MEPNTSSWELLAKVLLKMCRYWFSALIGRIVNSGSKPLIYHFIHFKGISFKFMSACCLLMIRDKIVMFKICKKNLEQLYPELLLYWLSISIFIYIPFLSSISKMPTKSCGYDSTSNIYHISNFTQPKNISWQWIVWASRPYTLAVLGFYFSKDIKLNITILNIFKLNDN